MLCVPFLSNADIITMEETGSQQIHSPKLGLDRKKERKKERNLHSSIISSPYGKIFREHELNLKPVRSEYQPAWRQLSASLLGTVEIDTISGARAD